MENLSELLKLGLKYISINFEKKLILYFIKNKIATITKKDNDTILKIIKKYYAFEEVNIKNTKKSKQNNCKENREKVLT